MKTYDYEYSYVIDDAKRSNMTIDEYHESRIKAYTDEKQAEIDNLKLRYKDADKITASNSRRGYIIFVLLIFIIFGTIKHFRVVFDFKNQIDFYETSLHSSSSTISAQAQKINQLNSIVYGTPSSTINVPTKTKSCKVAGVTFANPDGTKRQHTLAAFYRSNGGPGSGSGRLSRYTYEGEPAIYVLLNNKIIGNIPADQVSSVLSIYDDIDDVSIYVGRFTTDEGELIYFARANIEY